jgi:cell division septation protein DedD
MSITNGSTVTVHETRSGWSRIGPNQWVASWLLRDGTVTAPTVLWRVQIGASQNKATADSIAATARARGFSTFTRKVGSWYRVQVGAFEVRANADAMVTRARNAGFADAWARSD